MEYKRILTIQDISCVGQCSLTVALPILSACGHEICILPPAVLSTHTGGFGKPVVRSLAGMMPDTVAHWKENGIDFDIIQVGYLGSVEAVDTVSDILDTMLKANGIAIVDPAMADHGRLYSGLSDRYAEKMKQLCMKAHIMIPNVTEAAMMTGIDYQEELTPDYIEALLRKLGGGDVVLTGVGFEASSTGFALRQGSEITFCHHDRVEKNYHGTGDIFAAVLTGALASGKCLQTAAEIAGDFTLKCIKNTFENPAHWYGVKFETVLPELIRIFQS